MLQYLSIFTVHFSLHMHEYITPHGSFPPPHKDSAHHVSPMQAAAETIQEPENHSALKAFTLISMHLFISDKDPLQCTRCHGGFLYVFTGENPGH